MAKLSPDELFSELRRTIASDDSFPLESLRAELEEEFESAVNKLYRECVAEEFKRVEVGEQQELRGIYEQKRSKISELYTDICLFEKGTEIFGENESLSADLRAFLLRSLCTELANSLLLALADPFSQQSPQQQNFSQKVREQFIANLESKEAQKLAKGLFDNFDSFEHFHEAVQRLADCGGIKLRQPDKRERSDRQHKIEAELRSQLALCSDPPTFLLLAVLLTLKMFFGVTVHASGKFVQPLIIFISSRTNKIAVPSLPSELNELLTDTQRLVVACIRKRRSNESGRGGAEEEKQLATKMGKLRELFDRPTAAEEEKEEEEETNQ
ncbi:hypothetical protein niasHT_015383 [Heterodera trifolii]|uniref:Uncharacterized protein n=1 Tax=Heterodera trifolii TaxID=157864 RepID=A0ABD2L042_9BILA